MSHKSLQYGILLRFPSCVGIVKSKTVLRIYESNKTREAIVIT